MSVDLDDLPCYFAIHGLSSPAAPSEDLVLERCLPRFLELFDELGIRATFFVIGRSLGHRSVDARLRETVAAGHELGNHTFDHAYDLVTRTPASMADDLHRCDLRLRDLGAEVVGFRAPGYTHDQRLLDVIARAGYRYDSSSLPSLPYYGAKLGAIAITRLLGRRSQSLVHGGRAFLGLRRPHRLRNGLIEIPISVSDRLRIPLFGTSLLCSPHAAAHWLEDQALRQEFLHVELHGLDLLDPSKDGLPSELASWRPETRVDLATKLRRLAQLLRARGPCTRLCDVVVA